jgi:hypothetical protein
MFICLHSIVIVHHTQVIFFSVPYLHVLARSSGFIGLSDRAACVPCLTVANWSFHSHTATAIFENRTPDRLARSRVIIPILYPFYRRGWLINRWLFSWIGDKLCKYICIYIYTQAIYIYIYLYIYVCVFVFLAGVAQFSCIGEKLCKYIYIHTHAIYIYLFIYLCVCVFVFLAGVAQFSCIGEKLCKYIYIYTHTHTQYIFIYLCVFVCFFGWSSSVFMYWREIV